MNREYVFSKQKFQKEGIEVLKLFFDNGDYFPIKSEELIDISVNLYDRPVWNGGSYSPVAESGFLKLKIDENAQLDCENYFLYNKEDYEANRKNYIENRCVNEGGLKCVRLYDDLNWHNTIFGNTVAEIDGEFLIIKFIPQANFGTSNNKNHVIRLNDIDKCDVKSIFLDFENCEGFTVYRNEISELELEFEKELDLGNYDFLRKIRGGYIKIKLDETLDYRYVNEWLSSGKKKKTVSQLEKRIVGHKEKGVHDICHLYITYRYYEETREECLEIDDIRPDEELDNLIEIEEETGEDCGFDGGYAKVLKDGTILITFGKNAEKLLNEIN